MKHLYLSSTLIIALVLAGCMSSPSRYSRVQGYAHNTGHTNQAQPAEESYTPNPALYEPVDLGKTTYYADNEWHDGYLTPDADPYEAEWWQYYETNQQPVELTPPPSINYYVYSDPFWYPYQHYYVEQHYPHSNLSIGFGFSGYGYPGYSPLSYSAGYDRHYNPFWDDQYASFRYQHYYRAGGFASLQPAWYYSPLYWHPHHAYYNHRFGYPYYYYPIHHVRVPHERREPREGISRRREVLFTSPPRGTTPTDEDESAVASKETRGDSVWDRNRGPINTQSRPSGWSYTPQANTGNFPSRGHVQPFRPQISTEAERDEAESLYPLRPPRESQSIRSWSDSRFEFKMNGQDIFQPNNSRTRNMESMRSRSPFISPSFSKPRTSPSRSFSNPAPSFERSFSPSRAPRSSNTSAPR